MADRRDDERRFKGEWREPETDRRIDRWADRYRGADERGYRGGERLGHDWDRREYHGEHSHLAGLHDLDDLSELREGYREYRRHRDAEPPLRHGGLLGLHRAGAPRPMGRGPKGYTRSDERIREDICERLMTMPYDASDVEITVIRGEVTLTGTVRTRPDKWGIEDVADSVLGVQDVHNQIRLNRGEAQASETTLPGDTGNLHS